MGCNGVMGPLLLVPHPWRALLVSKLDRDLGCTLGSSSKGLPGIAQEHKMPLLMKHLRLRCLEGEN